jgi:hypothetical protein
MPHMENPLSESLRRRQALGHRSARSQIKFGEGM